MKLNELLSQFQNAGSDLFQRGLITSHGGNMSIRRGDRLIITGAGARLGRLGADDLIETGIYADDESTALASTELPVHRAIYQQTAAMAVVHAHPAHAIALSFVDREIVPIDTEGAYHLDRVPVLGWGRRLFSGELADDIARALIERHAAMAYGHGSFAIGRDLDEAHHYTSTLEESCRIIYMVGQLKK